jgi:hypothetical protein
MSLGKPNGIGRVSHMRQEPESESLKSELYDENWVMTLVSDTQQATHGFVA